MSEDLTPRQMALAIVVFAICFGLIALKSCNENTPASRSGCSDSCQGQVGSQS